MEGTRKTEQEKIGWVLGVEQRERQKVGSPSELEEEWQVGWGAQTPAADPEGPPAVLPPALPVLHPGCTWNHGEAARTPGTQDGPPETPMSLDRLLGRTRC